MAIPFRDTSTLPEPYTRTDQPLRLPCLFGTRSSAHPYPCWPGDAAAPTEPTWLTAPEEDPRASFAPVPANAGSPASVPSGETRIAEVVRGHHLRAARALLGWAMQDLAGRSGLSLSTVRRMEDDAESVLGRNRGVALHTLEAGGIRFLVLDDGTLALTRPADAPPGA